MSFKTLTAPIRKRPALAVMAACLLLGTGMWLIPVKKSNAQAPAAPRAAMTVTLTSPKAQNWPVVISANGNIEAWQESLVGAEIGGYALTAVDAQIGDKVKRGQVLAQFNHETLKSSWPSCRLRWPKPKPPGRKLMTMPAGCAAWVRPVPTAAP